MKYWLFIINIIVSFQTAMNSRLPVNVGVSVRPRRKYTVIELYCSSLVVEPMCVGSTAATLLLIPVESIKLNLERRSIIIVLRVTNYRYVFRYLDLSLQIYSYNIIVQ